MKVCIIIPNYNHSQWLDESIKSARNQSYKNLEIIVADDGSSDKKTVEEIIKKNCENDDRVKFINFEKNTGKWFVLNEAIRNTSCDLITTLDADDVCCYNRIERQVDVFRTNPGIVHVLTSFYHCWTQEDIEKNVQKITTGSLNIIEQNEVASNVLRGYMTPGINHFYTGEIETAGASAMFYRNVWELGIRFNPPQMGIRTLLSEDSDFNFRVCSLLGRTVILNEKLYCYRRNTSTNKELY